MILRYYEPTDDLQLRHLDEKCPQGSGISIYHRCPRFIAHAEMYGVHFTVVAESDGKIIGVTSGALKELRFGMVLRKVGYIFDVRVDPAARHKGIGQSLVLEVGGMLEKAGAELLYAIVMDSNYPAKRLFTDGLGFQQRAAFVTYTIPVFRHRDVRSNIEVIDTAAGIDKQVSSSLEQHSFFVPGVERYPELGQFLCFRATVDDSWAALCRSTREQVFDLMIRSLTPGIRFARSILNGLEHVYPVPKIPSVGQPLMTWWLSEPIVDGPRGLDLFKSLMSHINNMALQAGITTLLIQIDLKDPVRELVRQVAFRDTMSQAVGRLATIKSVLLTKELTEGLSQNLGPVYADTRDF